MRPELLHAQPLLLLMAPFARTMPLAAALNAAAWFTVACPLERALGSVPLAHLTLLLAAASSALFWALFWALARCARTGPGGLCEPLYWLAADACAPCLPGVTLALAALEAARGGAAAHRAQPWLPSLSARATACAVAALLALAPRGLPGELPPLLWLACAAAAGAAAGRGALGRLAALPPGLTRSLEAGAEACCPVALRECTELVPATGSAALPPRGAADAPAAAPGADAAAPARWAALEWLSSAAAGAASAAAAAAAPPPPRFRHDCFLSYRRADFAVADAAEAQLRLAGLRVFQDRSGGAQVSGQPFDTALVAALASSAVFCPLITLGVMQSLRAVDGHKVDWCLLEFVAALELHARGALRALYPLAVGAECAAPDGRPARDRLFSNAAFKARRGAARHALGGAVRRG